MRLKLKVISLRGLFAKLLQLFAIHQHHRPQIGFPGKGASNHYNRLSIVKLGEVNLTMNQFLKHSKKHTIFPH